LRSHKFRIEGSFIPQGQAHDTMLEDRNCFVDEMEGIKFVYILEYCPSPSERDKG
jgi:hypothetical protein